MGFGAQSLVKDYFNGALILLENQFAIGDVVTVANTTGTVEDFSLRRTTVRDLDGVLHTVPNSEIRVASNRTRVWAGINLDVTVALGTDIERATRVVNEACEAMAAAEPWATDVLETPAGAARRGDRRARRSRSRSLGKVRAPALPAAHGELRRRLLGAFAANGIELPRPQRVVLAKDPFRTRSRPAGQGAGPEPGGPVGRHGVAIRPHGLRSGRAAPIGRVEWPDPQVAAGETRERRAPAPGRRSRTSSPSAARSRPTPPSSPRPTPPPPCTRRRTPTTSPSGRARPASACRGSPSPTETLEWDLPFAKWFTGGQLNVTYNCVDRHVEAGLGDKVAYHWIGEPGDTRTLTYADLQRESAKAANALLELGVKTGDRVAIYMPMIPELPIAMLACARIGAPHTVVFGGFSAEALSGRINDCGAKVLITADGGWRRGKKVGLKHHADEAVASAPTIEHVIVVDRFGDGAHMVPRRDHWWHEIVDRQSEDCPPVPVDSEHMLYLLYTSGTTAKPKGILHTSAGYLLGASFTHWAVFDLKPDDVYWCAADIGWVTGHSYIVYGPLANGATGLLYEGAPDTPSWERWWEIVEEYKVTSCTAPRPPSAPS